MKLILSTLFIAVAFLCTAQESSKTLTDHQKEELRKNHTSGLTFKSKTATARQLTTSNAKEEVNIQQNKVKYYYGKKDSLYKEFNYTKP